jgi:hypothetical protein
VLRDRVGAGGEDLGHDVIRRSEAVVVDHAVAVVHHDLRAL